MPLLFPDVTFCCSPLYDALCFGHIVDKEMYTEQNIEEKKFYIHIRHDNHQIKLLRIKHCPFCGSATMVIYEDNSRIIPDHWTIIEKSLYDHYKKNEALKPNYTLKEKLDERSIRRWKLYEAES